MESEFREFPCLLQVLPGTACIDIKTFELNLQLKFERLVEKESREIRNHKNKTEETSMKMHLMVTSRNLSISRNIGKRLKQKRHG